MEKRKCNTCKWNINNRCNIPYPPGHFFKNAILSWLINNIDEVDENDVPINPITDCPGWVDWRVV